MWQPLKGLLETTWQLSSLWHRSIGVTFLVLAILSIGFSVINEPLLTEHRIVWLTLLLITFFSAVIPPVANMTRYRHKYVLYVVLWGLISLAFVLVIFYLYFFALAQTEAQQKQWDRVLNLPPIFAAAIAAAIGWYAVHQFSAKNNRTNNSFSLVMQTRCNAEFMKHAANLTLALPTPIVLNESHKACFPPSARNRLAQLKQKLATEGNLSGAEAAEKVLLDEQILSGIEAGKYLLNFYEFMAYGIYAGDLDEDLLYETISPAVGSLFDRFKALRDYLNGPNGDKLAFEHLHRLIEGYEKVEAGTRKPVDGWRRRLDMERARI